jgi:ribosomal protein S18 acetylase RimI-like enzyme
VVAEAGGELVGFSVVGPGRDEDAPAPTELYAIYARATWWGSGLGQLLWDAVDPDEPCSLWVLEANDRARAFYRRNGFVADGAREHYSGLDAWEIRMVRR